MPQSSVKWGKYTNIKYETIDISKKKPPYDLKVRKDFLHKIKLALSVIEKKRTRKSMKSEHCWDKITRQTERWETCA